MTHGDFIVGCDPSPQSPAWPDSAIRSTRSAARCMSVNEQQYCGVTGDERFQTAFRAMRGMCISRVLVLLVALLAVVPLGSSTKDKQVPGCAHAPTEHSLEPHGMPKLVKQHPPSLPHYVRAGHQGAPPTTEAESQPWWAQFPNPAYHR